MRTINTSQLECDAQVLCAARDCCHLTPFILSDLVGTIRLRGCADKFYILLTRDDEIALKNLPSQVVWRY